MTHSANLSQKGAKIGLQWDEGVISWKAVFRSTPRPPAPSFSYCRAGTIFCVVFFLRPRLPARNDNGLFNGDVNFPSLDCVGAQRPPDNALPNLFFTFSALGGSSAAAQRSGSRGTQTEIDTGRAGSGRLIATCVREAVRKRRVRERLAPRARPARCASPAQPPSRKHCATVNG